MIIKEIHESIAAQNVDGFGEVKFDYVTMATQRKSKDGFLRFLRVSSTNLTQSSCLSGLRSCTLMNV